MLRNKEIRTAAIVFFIIAAFTIILEFYIGFMAGIISIISASAFGIMFFYFTKERYENIAKLSEEIDKVLHNEDELFIGEYEEGELSILSSEITKMTLCIREQNSALKKEKQYLADSLADIAHQLRTPLTSVNLVLSLIEDTTDEKQRKLFVRESEELLTHMEWLINSLLKLSRLDAGIISFEKKPIDVKTLVNVSLRSFLISMELHDIKSKVTISEGININGDYRWLSEAVQNILENCIESCGDGGKIEINCEDTLLFTEISIHDSGAGFEKEDLSYLFDRFYRGRNTSASGYGIGLALCKKIIAGQNGTIKAKNHPNGGAVFYIRFPK